MKRYKFNNLKDSETNTQAACYLSSLDLPYKTLIGLLKTDDFHLKHFALINLKNIDAKGMELLIFNLINQDSKIRETSSLRIKCFVLENKSLISHFERNIPTICQSLNDVNPQVCRNIIDVLPLVENKNILIGKILEMINSILAEVDIENIVKNHKFNKKVFNLYWNLYAIESLISQDFQYFEQLLEILGPSSKANNYTIRERAARIIAKLEKNNFDITKFKNRLIDDENFYVRAALAENLSAAV